MISAQIFPRREFYKKLVVLVIPISLQSFMVSLVNASDALMLARLDQTALSAVSLATQIAFVANLFLAAFSSGLSIFASQYWGKGDRAAIARIFAYVLKISTLVALIFFVFSLFFPRFLMKIYTDSQNLIEEGAMYLKIASPSFLCAGISQMYLCILKNSSHAGKASLITAVSVILNIFLNAVLIYGLFGFPQFGIKGAAIATVFARFVELVWSVAESSRRERIRPPLKAIIWSDSILRLDYWKYSYPVLVNLVAWGFGFSAYSVIMGHLGSDAVASNSIANIVKNLSAALSAGLASAGGIMVGNELGRGETERARICGGRLVRIALLTGLFTGLCLIAVTPLVLSLVDLSDTAKDYLKIMLILCSYNMIGKSSNTLTNCGIFPAGGDSKFSMICDAITMWAISVPVGFLLAFVFHAPVIVVFFAINLDEIVKMPAIYVYYKKYRWLRNLTRESV